MEFGIYTDVYLDSIKSTTTKKPAPVRKKFAVPPVKVACLEWWVFSAKAYSQSLIPS